MKHYSLQFGDYFFFVKKPIITSKYWFLRKLKIKKGSYIFITFSKIYDFFCNHAINLQKEYEKYYQKEYTSFEEYLRQKHNLFDDEIECLKNQNSYYKNIKICPNWNALGLFYDDRFVEIFANFFGGDFSRLKGNDED